MIDTTLNPDPDENQGPLSKPLAGLVPPEFEWSASTEGPVRVVGQREALNQLRGLVARYALERHEPETSARLPGAIGLLGPRGCGKKSCVREVAKDTGLTLAILDLNGTETEDVCQMAARALRRAVCDDVDALSTAVIYVDGLAGASRQVRNAVGRMLRDPEQVTYAYRGTKVSIDLRNVQWVVAFPTVELELSMEQRVLATFDLPPALCCAIEYFVVFRQLTAPELFEILSISELSPLHRLKETARRLVGVEVEVSELAMWKLIRDARDRHPDLGVHGLNLVVKDFEKNLWSEFVTGGKDDGR